MSTCVLAQAWQEFRLQHPNHSVDRMVCSPWLRQEFLEFMRTRYQLENEEEILWGVMSLRKRKQLPS